MFVYFSKYPDFVGPYQIAEMLCFWVPKTVDEFGHEEFPEWVDGFGEFLSNTPLLPLCQWIADINKRIEFVHLDKWDTWNVYSTLNPIILPLLKQLKETQHGAPYVDDDDVPEELRSTNAPPKKNEWDTDDFHFERWEWIIDQMIWSFNELTTDWENQFHSGVIDFNWEKDEATGYTRLEHGPNHTSVFDSDGYKRHYERIRNGTTLFGKYYQHLWC